MTGCYGNDPEDRHYENKLVNEDKDIKCPKCGSEGYDQIYTEGEQFWFCPDCTHTDSLF